MPLEMKIYAVIPILHNAIIIILMGNVRDTSSAHTLLKYCSIDVEHSFCINILLVNYVKKEKNLITGYISISECIRSKNTVKLIAVIPILHNAIIIILMGNVRDTSSA
jgi:hypothetical protein